MVVPEVKNFVKIIFSFTVACFLECSTSDSIANGSSSETVIGRIANLDGTPACSTIVTIFPDTYNPVTDRELDVVHSDTTDRNGHYLLNITGNYSGYTIVARKITGKTRALITEIRTSGVNDTVIVEDGILRNTGSIAVDIPKSLYKHDGYVYIPGTAMLAFVKDSSSGTVLDSVPAGIIPRIVYASESAMMPMVSRYDVDVISSDTSFVIHPQWQYAKSLYLNTTSAGASVESDIYNFPVLVRLNNKNFDFSLAEADGADIRFSKSDNTFLPFEIERWDTENEQAEIWIAMDTVSGNSDYQNITLLWGNSGIADESVNSVVFDTATGFQGVWHLAEKGNSTVCDATQNCYNGTPYSMADSSSVPGIIGKAMDFDGKSDFITMHNTAHSKLDFQENGYYAVSLWAYADSVDSSWHGIASKGHHQYYLQYKCFDDTAASWEFVEFQDQTGWKYSEHRTPQTPKEKEWVFLTGVRDGDRQYLYVNGELVKDDALVNPKEMKRNTDCDFSIGCHLKHDLLPDLEGLNYFDGRIDEVRVMNFVPDNDWVKLCYMNQKENDALIEWK